MNTMQSKDLPATVDLLVIGGGINGVGVARDAAGRGLSVLLCEQNDLAEGTSSRTGKYIHGGLRYLEYYEFRLVREALIEREVLLRMAPQIIWPMRVVIPHNKGLRPAWMLRAGLFLYDHLGGRELLPGTRAVNLRQDPVGASLKEENTKGFEYSDCWVDDARLVVLTALSAVAKGAHVLTRTPFTGARRENGQWVVQMTSKRDGRVITLRAKAIVNCAGPWVERALRGVTGVSTKKRVRLVKGSHIIVKKFWDGPQAYAIQNKDRRLLFVNPYMGDLALIGTTDTPYEGDAADVKADAGEIRYICDAVSSYFKHRLTPDQVIHAYSGVRPLLEDEAENPAAVTRDYEFEVDGAVGDAVIVSAFGGKLTTHRKLADHALEKLVPHFPKMTGPWTSKGHLPGGDIPNADFEAFATQLGQQYSGLPASVVRHHARLYGTRAKDVLQDARSAADLGQHFGAQCHERELRFLIDNEWAETAEDLLWRRTKHFLRLTAAERAVVNQWLAKQALPMQVRTQQAA